MSARESGRLAMPASARPYPRIPEREIERAIVQKAAEARPKEKPRPKLAKSPVKPPAKQVPPTRVDAESRITRSQPAAAKATVVEPPPTPTMLAVRKHTDGWALLVDDLDEPAFVVSTKRKAVSWAQDAARHHTCTLRIFKADGDLQTEKDYAA